MNQRLLISLPMTTLMRELNGLTISMPSEIKDNAVHAGPLELLKPLATDSQLILMERLIKFSLLKNSSLVILEIMDAKEVT